MFVKLMKWFFDIFLQIFSAKVIFFNGKIMDRLN